VIIRQSIRRGRPAGTATVLGNETGWLLWAVTAALGLSALLLASRWAYDTMRIAGAIVLVYFGARTLWHARHAAPTPQESLEPNGTPESFTWRSFRLGLLTNLANPKAGVFAVSFLPQFVPDGAAVPPTLLLLAITSAVIDLIWYLGIVYLVCSLQQLFQRPAARRRLEYVSGAVLVILGLRLALES
jgi:threonine/homoserine/homoserine lactone efflux protein